MRLPWGAKAFIPAHVGRFCIANHPWNEPFKQLAVASRDKKYALLTPKIGEPEDLNHPQKFSGGWTENQDKNFYAGDEMHRLGVNLTGIEEITKMSGKAKIEKQESKRSGGQAPMTISVDANGKSVVFQLNDSTAAQQLFAQLPLHIKVEDYGSNEKIFYPPKKLDTADPPKANAKVGTLAYYAPWGDVVMFYKNFGSATGLYELGHEVSGDENIKVLSGTVGIEKVQ
nr:cyclophilin-like fold protein [uncultured Desulfobacter sp.]